MKTLKNVLLISLILILKVATFGIYFYDFTKTRKLLQLDRSIKRQLSFLQRIEVYFFNLYIFAQFLIPFSVNQSKGLSLLIHFIGFVLTYLHINRWVFVSKKSIICRDEMYRVKTTYKINYEKNTLSFRSGSKNIKIRFPLVTKEHLERTIL